jgi:hypothetical protein
MPLKTKKIRFREVAEPSTTPGGFQEGEKEHI